MSSLLIRNTHVLIAQNDQVEIKENQDILIQSRRIESIQPTGQVDPSHFDQVIEAHGKLAMPGLMNTHAHTPMVLWRGLAEDVNIEAWFNDYVWHLESNLTEKDVYLGMLLGIAEMIECGVTSVIDHYWHPRQAAQAVDESGFRAVLCPAMFGSMGLEMIDQTAQFVQEYASAANGRITTMMAPHAPYTCDDEFLKATAQKAQSIGAAIHIHAAETIEQTQASLTKRGKTPIQILEETGILDSPTLIAHALGATPNDIEIMASHQVQIAHCAKTYGKLAMGYAPLADFRQAGLTVGFGSDGAMSNNTLDIFEVMRLTGLQQKTFVGDASRFTIAELLCMATEQSAKIMARPTDLGLLEAGRLADLILIDFSGTHHQPLYSMTASLVYMLKSNDVKTVIVDGQILMLDRELKTIDKASIIAEIQEQKERLTQKSGQQFQTYLP